MSTLAAAERTLLEEAASWRLLGLLFECPSARWQEQVAALAGEVGDAELRAAAEAAAEASEGLYHSIFGPGGPAAPREVSYRNSVELGYLLSEIESYYAAFAFRPETTEAPDHIAVEAGFIGYLRLKEAYALAGGDHERAAVTASAARTFIEEHLGAIAGPLAAALSQSGVRYLELAGKALARLAGAKTDAVLLPVLADDGTLECG